MKGQVNCQGFSASKKEELIKILQEGHAEFLLNPFWNKLNNSAHLNIYAKPEYRVHLEKAAMEETSFSDDIMILINDAFESI